MDVIRDFVSSVASKLEEFKASLSSSERDIKQLKDENTSINTGLEAIKGEIKSVNEQKTLFSTALAAFDGYSEKMKAFFRKAEIDYDQLVFGANKRINEAIEAIPPPKHGKDAVVDYKAINETIAAKFSDTKQEISKEIREEITDRVSKIQIPKPKEPEQVNYDVVDFKIRAALQPIKETQQAKVVKDVNYDSKKRALIVDYTDGKSKSIALPTGGGGTAVYQTGGGR